MNRPQSTRLAILLITPDLLADMLKPFAGRSGTARYRVTKNAIPETARVVTDPPFALPEVGAGVIGIVLEDESFEKLELGQSVPFLPAPEISVTFAP